MIIVRVYQQDEARRRHLRATERFDSPYDAGAYLTKQLVYATGLYYEVEERTDAPGDADGE